MYPQTVEHGPRCTGYRCGVVGWCASARRLASVLPAHWRVELVALILPRQSEARGDGSSGDGSSGDGSSSDGSSSDGSSSGGGSGGGSSGGGSSGGGSGGGSGACDEAELARQHCPGLRVLGAKRRMLQANTDTDTDFMSRRQKTNPIRVSG